MGLHLQLVSENHMVLDNVLLRQCFTRY